MERIKPETFRKIKVLRAYELAKESITHPCFECKVFAKGKCECEVEITMLNIHWDNFIKNSGEIDE